MARLSLRHLARTAGRGLAGYRRGQSEAEVAKRAMERQQMEFMLRVAPELRRRDEDAALNTFLGDQPEGRDLAGRGLSATAATGIYSGRLAARRAQQPSPSESRIREDRSTEQLRQQALDYATYLVAQSPGHKWTANSLRVAIQAKYPKLPNETAGAVATRALGLERRASAAPGAGLDDAVRRAAESLGVPPKP